MILHEANFTRRLLATIRARTCGSFVAGSLDNDGDLRSDRSAICIGVPSSGRITAPVELAHLKPPAAPVLMPTGYGGDGEMQLRPRVRGAAGPGVYEDLHEAAGTIGGAHHIDRPLAQWTAQRLEAGGTYNSYDLIRGQAGGHARINIGVLRRIGRRHCLREKSIRRSEAKHHCRGTKRNPNFHGTPSHLYFPRTESLHRQLAELGLANGRLD
jgi:hypothetical protein